jgi:hypothetical protein
MANYQKAEKILIKNHPELDEKWLQDRIAEDPAILGLGDVILKDRERIQPAAGRLDLLLQSANVDAPKRYEVEVQLGKTDEKHIIHTIEYWDIERKMYPQYDHCAVIVAEEVTGRFLNVIGLFGGSIPLIALQVSAIKVGEHLTLTFTRVVDEIRRGLDDDGPDPVALANRAYWEESNKTMLEVADEALGILRTFDASLELSYNKAYIGLTRQGRANNFVYFEPRKNNAVVCIKLPQSEDLDKEFEEAELVLLPYDARYGAYRPRLSKGDLTKHGGLIRKVLEMAYKNAIE